MTYSKSSQEKFIHVFSHVQSLLSPEPRFLCLIGGSGFDPPRWFDEEKPPKE